jgi:hypothetical protein
VSEYRVSLYTSAEKELLPLPDLILARLFRNIELLASNSRQRESKRCVAAKICGAFAWVSTVGSISSTTEIVWWMGRESRTVVKSTNRARSGMILLSILPLQDSSFRRASSFNPRYNRQRDDEFI